MALRALVGLALGLAGCAHVVQLEEILATQKQLTGVAVSAQGRLFISFPRWVDEPTPSVAEVTAGGGLEPFPNAEWNTWDGKPATVADHLVCVQSVFVDAADRLWILDPASPRSAGVVPGAAKLLQVDLTSGRVARVYRFDAAVVPTRSYLNDVRIDAARGRAYIADSGMGGIVVVDLESGAARRRLDGVAATAVEEIVVRVAGAPWLGPDGKTPGIATDGIALDAAGQFVYFQSLTGRTLYRVPAASLADEAIADAELGRMVERVALTAAADGLLADSRGNLFVTDLEHDSVRVRAPDGTFTNVVQDPKLSWPATLALDAAGRLYITAAQVHRMPKFNGGVDKRERPFRLYRTTAAAVP